MKTFFKWLFTTGSGILMLIVWLLFSLIFVWKISKAIAELILNGSQVEANVLYFFSLLVISIVSLLTARNYNRYKGN